LAAAVATAAASGQPHLAVYFVQGEQLAAVSWVGSDSTNLLVRDLVLRVMSRAQDGGCGLASAS
jgi:hypothetical protein